MNRINALCKQFLPSNPSGSFVHPVSTSYNFNGKRVLVTGAASGIGKEISQHLTRQGAHVIALDLNEKLLKVLNEEIGGEYVVCNLIDAEATQRAIASLGRIDCLVNNAGVTNLDPFVDVKMKDFDFVMSINCRAVFVVGQAVAKKMIAQGTGGTIVNMSSQASMRCLPDHTAYCTSKAAVNMLTKMMAYELGKHKIRVNAVGPTVVMTEMGRKAWPPAKAAPMLARIPQGKFAEPSDVANLVLYLLSGKSDMVNGSMIPLEGGFYTG